MLAIRVECCVKAAKSLGELVHRAKPEGIARTSLSKGASAPRAFLRPVRIAKEPAALAGWEGLMRTNSRVSGREAAGLPIVFC